MKSDPSGKQPEPGETVTPGSTGEAAGREQTDPPAVTTKPGPGRTSSPAATGSTSPAGTGRGVHLPIRVPALLAALAAATTMLALFLAGSFDWSGVADTSAVVRYGLPLALSATNLLAAATVGLLLVIVFLVPDRSGDRWALTGTRQYAVRWAGYLGFVWFLLAAVVLLLSAGEQTGTSAASTDAVTQLIFFVRHVELGQILTVSMLLALVCSQLALSANRVTTTAWALVLAIAAIVPLSLNGHSSGAADHINAVNSLLVHVLAAAVWVGGLIALVVLSPFLRRPLEAARRFSPVAAICFVLVGLSGLDSAWLRLGSRTALTTAYGAMVLVKVGLLIALGVFGWWHRRRRLAAEQADPRHTMLRLAGVELLLMGLAMGLGQAIDRTVPPVAQATITDPDYSFTYLVGFERPPAMSWTTIFTQWFPDRMMIALIVAMVLAYALGVRKLRRRGDSWPIWATLNWMAGCLLLFWVTNGGPLVYGMITFSGHMIMHMLLMMAVPPLLVLGNPITLALRALPPRRDASTGPREWLLSVAHSRALRILANPVVASVQFSAGLILFYFTALFPIAMATHTGHMLMTFHFLLSGYLFCWMLIGTDPGPPKAAYPVRLIIVMATMAVHAFVNVTLMTGDQIYAADWWPQLGLTDTVALLDDQRRGAMIAWGTGDGPTLLLMMGVALNWARSSEREARRFDRQADRDGDAQLAAYNAYLAALSGGRKRPDAEPIEQEPIEQEPAGQEPAGQEPTEQEPTGLPGSSDGGSEHRIKKDISESVRAHPALRGASADGSTTD